VARLRTGDQSEWLLIEAKANSVEFATPHCRASEEGGLNQIEKALSKVKTALRVHWHYPLTGTYYQYANRLAVHHRRAGAPWWRRRIAGAPRVQRIWSQHPSGDIYEVVVEIVPNTQPHNLRPHTSVVERAFRAKSFKTSVILGGPIP